MSDLYEVDRMPSEWSSREDELGIVYCLGRVLAEAQQEAAVAYYRTDLEMAGLKTALGNGRSYKKLIFNGNAYERHRFAQVERPEVVERIVSQTSSHGSLQVSTDSLTVPSPDYRSVTWWLNTTLPAARAYQRTLEEATRVLTGAGVDMGDVSLYGSAGHGLVGAPDRIVDDVDIVFRQAAYRQLTHAVKTLQKPFRWSELDPGNYLSLNSKRLQAKRWSTAQLRMTKPYPYSIDIRVGREPGQPTLWDHYPAGAAQVAFEGELHVLDDSESLCASPALRCVDQSGAERILLLKGYHFVGAAAKGDTIEVRGTGFRNSPVIVVTMSGDDELRPDLRSVLID